MPLIVVWTHDYAYAYMSVSRNVCRSCTYIMYVIGDSDSDSDNIY